MTTSSTGHVLASLLAFAALSAACSKGAPTKDDGTSAPRGVGSVTSASMASPAAADPKKAPLLPVDPNWSRTERIARVLSVTPCGKKEGQLCERVTVQNVGKVDIAELVDVRLCAYDAKGKALGTNTYENKPAAPVGIKAGATVSFELLVNDDPEHAAKAMEGEVVLARLAGAPKGRTWANPNLATSERPKGGFDAKTLDAMATLPVRVLAFDPHAGIVHVRNEAKRKVTQMTLSAYGWRRGDGVLAKVGGYSFMARDLKLGGPLAPGEERDIDISGGEKDRYFKPELVAHTVAIAGVAYDGGELIFNANVEPDLSERPLEDLPGSAR